MPRRRSPRQSPLLVRIAAAPAACLAVLGAAVLAPAGAAYAGSSYFTSSANSARASNGLPSYSVASDLTAIAQRHARAMAQRQSIYHNSSLGSEACCWRSLGENVGVGSSDSQVQRAFMNSSAHRGNILSSTFNEIGVGTATGSDGRIYVDEVFRARTGSRPSTSTVTRTHRSTSSAHPAPRAVTRAPARPARPSAAALLARKLHGAVAGRATPPDPVAAAISFSVVMRRLAH